MTRAELIAFSEKMAVLFSEGQILTPVHLSGGNEDKLIDIFDAIGEDDWVFSTYRSHYHALLKGIPVGELEAMLLEGRSMHIASNRYKFFTSSIVGGCLSIATGVAMGIKRRGGSEKVWCFIGDMASTMGVYSECERYAEGQDLPIRFVIEDNSLSVETPTNDVWGNQGLPAGDYYYYERTYPHQGAGVFVEFR